jgi:hypothetical protein
MRLRKPSSIRLAAALLPLSIAAIPRQAHAQEPVSAPRHCASVALGYAGTYIGGSTGENHYPYAGSAADLRADYSYCAIPHFELGAGLDYYWASNWHGFVPALILRGYLGPSTRKYELGLHVRGGVALVTLPYGSAIGGTAVQLVGPPHDELLVGPSLTGGLDFRSWVGAHIAFVLSLDVGVAPTSQEQSGGDHDLLTASASIGVVAGW